MSAQVEKMFSVREMPWHREGTVLDDYPQNWDEARKLAGLEWEPIEEPVFALDGIDGEGREIYAKLDDWKRISRSDTHATLYVAQQTYAIINHAAFGDIFEAVLQQDSNLKAETGGCLDGGRAVWMLVKLDEPIMVPGDKSATMPYLALTSRHDGQGATSLRATAVRIVCGNTFRAAEMEGERTGTTFSFIHRSGWKDRITEAREAVTGARRELREYAELAADLMGLKVTPEQQEMFVTAFIPAPPAGLATDRVLRNVEMSRTKLRELLAGPTVVGSEIDGTAYGLVQGAGEYLDHIRKARTWETKLNRTLMQAEPLKAKATTLAREVAKV